MRAFAVEDCEARPSCFGSNATSPYLVGWLPPESGAQPIREHTPATRAWRLRADEAVILVGRTPPRAAYYSFTPYLFSRHDPATGQAATIFASLSDALNLANIRTGSDGVFEQPFALVIAADVAVHEDARRALARHAVPGTAINTLVLPTNELRVGPAPDPDTLQLLARVALFDDPSAGQAYLARPPLMLFRVAPRQPRTSIVPLPVPARVPRGSGTSEQALTAALDALDAAIRASLRRARSNKCPSCPPRPSARSSTQRRAYAA